MRTLSGLLVLFIQLKQGFGCDATNIYANISVPDNIGRIGTSLYAEVFLKSQVEGCEARATFVKVKQSTTSQYATPWSSFEEDGQLILNVFRLAPRVAYKIQVQVRSKGNSTSRAVILTEILDMPATLWPFLDSGNMATVEGDPTFELLAIDVQAFSQAPVFDGFVIIDRDGDVVWLWNITTTYDSPDEGEFTSHSIDQRPGDYNFVMQSMIAERPIGVVSPFGILIEKLEWDPSCLIITHEARFNSDYTAAYTVKEIWGEFEGLTNPQIGDVVVSYDVATNSISEVVNLWDHFDPVTERGYLSNNGTANPNLETCNGTTANAYDWSHLNSVAVSKYDQSLIVSIRHLSTVCSFEAPPKSGLRWCVSSELPGRSNFNWIDDDDKFYDQHGVGQLANGNLYLFDNGNARVEGGYNGGGENSRGMEYELDFDAWTIKKVWSVDTVYCSHEGNVSPHGDDGHFIIHVPNKGGDRRRMQDGGGGQTIPLERFCPMTLKWMVTASLLRL